jgi:hypothetical protein
MKKLIIAVALVIIVLFILSLFSNDNISEPMESEPTESTQQTNKSKVKPDILVHDFCTLPIKDLEVKYGVATKEFSGKDDVYNWTLQKYDGIRVMLFYTGKKREVARFFNIELGSIFWYYLGWDDGEVETYTPGEYQIIRKLQGIDEALYKYNQKMLDIKLKSNLTNFGKNE